ncbi:MAG: hypothetical protein WA632_10910 [Gallionella sp.]
MCGLILSLFTLSQLEAHAQVIDNISISKAGKEAEIQLHFITRIRYVRNAVLKNGDIRIYVTLQNIDPTDPRLRWEQQNSPPSDIVLPFSLTYPELDSSLTLSFGKSVKYRVSAGHDGQSVSIFTPLLRPAKSSKEVPSASLPGVAVPIAAVPVVIAPAVAAGPSAESTAPADAPISQQSAAPEDANAPKVMTPEQVDLEAQKLYFSANEAMQKNQIDQTVVALNKLLDLPPNVLSQSAQSMMGEAREKNGEFAKARAEYELYLKLYPKAADIKLIQARLDKLPKEDTVKVKGAPSEIVQKTLEEKLQVSGGISQNFFTGTTHTDSFASDGINPPTLSTFDATDQKQLTTSLDLTARKRTDKLDTRLVLREYNRINFLPNQPEDYRWNAVYIEQSSRDRKFMYRVGRQSGMWGSMPGRFDGLVGGYSLNETWRVNAAVGVPVEYTSGGWDPGDSRIFYSGNIELTRLPNEWSGSLYGFLQTSGGGYNKIGGTGIADRAAVGAEAHYFETNRNYMMQVEYDKIYRKVNLATFQGNWTQASGTNFYVNLDHRRSPPLTLSTSGQFTASVKELLASQLISIQELRDNAIALSMISNSAAVGASRQVLPKLRLATDFRVSNSGGTGAIVTTLNSIVGTQDGFKGNGNTYSYSLQAIGNGLFVENDMGIASGTLIKSETTKGQSLMLSQVNTFKERWRLDTSLMLYSQDTNTGTHSTQIRPSMSVNYRLSDSWNFNAEAGLEQYRTSNTLSSDKTHRKYVYAGYRWDFR